MPDHPKESASARYRRLAGECWEIAHTFPAGNWAQNRRIFAQRSERSLKIRRCAIGETLARFLVRDIMAGMSPRVTGSPRVRADRVTSSGLQEGEPSASK